MPLPPDKVKIGRALLAGGPVTAELLQQELERTGKATGVLGKALLQSGFPTEEELFTPLLARLRIPKVNARNTKIPLETIRLLPEEVARRTRVLPLDQIGSILIVVTPEIDNEQALSEARKASGLLLTPIQCGPDGFDEILTDYYQRLAQSGLAPAPSPPQQPEAPAPAPAGGAVAVIPAGSDGEDEFFKRYMTTGPVVAEETLL